MLDIALKNIYSKRTRSALCIIGVLICVFLIGTMEGLSNRLLNEIEGEVTNLNDKMYFQQKGTGYPPIGSNINISSGDQVLQRDDIDANQSMNILFIAIEPGERPMDPPEVLGVGLEPGKESLFTGNAKASKGKADLTGEDENAVILGSSAAAFFDVSVGDSFSLRKGSCEVVGVLRSTDVPTVDGSVIMSLSFGQQLFERMNVTSAVLLTAKDGYSRKDIEKDIESANANIDVYTQREIEEELNARMETPRTMLSLINSIVFVVTIVIVMNVMMMSVKEKTKEIGTMRAIGTKKSAIMQLIIYESLLISVIGGIIGLLIINPTLFIIGLITGLAVLEPLSYIVVLRVLILIFLIGMFSGLIPTYLATRISPLEALRYE
jgi:putative ABC transport system permease protein